MPTTSVNSFDENVLSKHILKIIKKGDISEYDFRELIEYIVCDGFLYNNFEDVKKMERELL